MNFVPLNRMNFFIATKLDFFKVEISKENRDKSKIKESLKNEGVLGSF